MIAVYLNLIKMCNGRCAWTPDLQSRDQSQERYVRHRVATMWHGAKSNGVKGLSTIWGPQYVHEAELNDPGNRVALTVRPSCTVYLLFLFWQHHGPCDQTSYSSSFLETSDVLKCAGLAAGVSLCSRALCKVVAQAFPIAPGVPINHVSQIFRHFHQYHPSTYNCQPVKPSPQPVVHQTTIYVPSMSAASHSEQPLAG